MASVLLLRHFIREKLDAAAEEIYSEVEKNIRLLEISLRLQITQRQTELQQLHKEEEEVLMELEHPEPVQMKEEETHFPVMVDVWSEAEPLLIKGKDQEPQPPQFDLEDSEPALMTADQEEQPEPALMTADQEEQEPAKNKQTEPPKVENDPANPEPLQIKEEQPEPAEIQSDGSGTSGHQEEPEAPKMQDDDGQESQELEDDCMDPEPEELGDDPVDAEPPPLMENQEGRRIGVEEQQLKEKMEEERRRHLLDLSWKPVVKLHRIALHQLQSKNSNQPPQQTGDQQKNCSLVAEKKRLRNGKEEQLVVKQDGHQHLPSIGRNPSEHQVRDDKESGRTDQTQQSDGGAPTDQNPLKGKSLINHQNDTNAGENVFLCKSCAKDSAPVTPADSKAPYCCSKCRGNFTSTGEPASSPNADEKPFSCSECEKSFETEEALTQHMKEYSEVKHVFCPECGNNFKTKHWLMAHRRLYAQTRPNFQCICGQFFGEEDDLLKHRKSYHSEKAYVCDYCKMSFSRKSSLQMHTQMHRYLHITKTKPTKRFQCDLCKKSYCFKKKLESHMMGHVKKLHSREMLGKIQK